MPAKIGSTTYVFKSRAEAAKFTGRIMRVQKQVRGEKAGGISVGWAQLKSGLTRQVSLPDASTAAEYYAMQPLEADLTKMTEKELCTRKSTVYDVPPDFRWSRGDAKNNYRQVVVRHWTNSPGQEGSSIHTGLSMEDKLMGVNDYATWAPAAIRLSDWSRSRNPIKRLLAPTKMVLDNLRTRDYPDPADSYQDDKNSNLRWSSKAKLRKGVEARQKLTEVEAQLKESSGEVMQHDQRHKPETARSSQITDDLIAAARFKPLPNQKASSKDPKIWQRRAEKDYLPCIGPDKDRATGKEKFVMFGLHLDKMRQSWQELQDEDHPRYYYKAFSTDQNCSGMCSSLLLKGGAGHFLPFKTRFVTTQTDLQKYSARLVEKLDRLNKSVEFLDHKVKLHEVPDQPSLSLNNICQKLESLSAKYTMPGEWSRDIYRLIRIIKELETASLSTDELTPIAERMTVLLHSLYNDTETHPYVQYKLGPAFHAFKILKNKMEKAYAMESSE